MTEPQTLDARMAQAIQDMKQARDAWASVVTMPEFAAGQQLLIDLLIEVRQALAAAREELATEQQTRVMGAKWYEEQRRNLMDRVEAAENALADARPTREQLAAVLTEVVMNRAADRASRGWPHSCDSGLSLWQKVVLDALAPFTRGEGQA